MSFFKNICLYRPFDKSVLFILLLWAFACESNVAQISIDVTGSWNTVLSATSITEAGNDFPSTFTSASNQVSIDIFKPGFLANLFNYSWRVDVRKADIDWHPNLILSVQRTGNGTPYWLQGTISGGTSFQQISNINQTFFSGTRSTFSIPIQFQLTGVSVLLPAKTYSTSVIFTVTEL